MIFANHISDITRTMAYIEMALGPVERLRLDSIDARRLDLRLAAERLREAAARCDAIADRFDDAPVELEHLIAAE